MHRYHAIGYIFELNFEDGFELVEKCIEKEAEEKLWQLYIAKSSMNDLPPFEEILEDSKKKANTQSYETFENIENEIDDIAERLKQKQKLLKEVK